MISILTCFIIPSLSPISMVLVLQWTECPHSSLADVSVGYRKDRWKEVDTTRLVSDGYSTTDYPDFNINIKNQKELGLGLCAFWKCRRAAINTLPTSRDINRSSEARK